MRRRSKCFVPPRCTCSDATVAAIWSLRSRSLRLHFESASGRSERVQLQMRAKRPLNGNSVKDSSTCSLAASVQARPCDQPSCVQSPAAPPAPPHVSSSPLLRFFSPGADAASRSSDWKPNAVMIAESTTLAENEESYRFCGHAWLPHIAEAQGQHCAPQATNKVRACRALAATLAANIEHTNVNLSRPWGRRNTAAPSHDNADSPYLRDRGRICVNHQLRQCILRTLRQHWKHSTAHEVRTNKSASWSKSRSRCSSAFPSSIGINLLTETQRSQCFMTRREREDNVSTLWRAK